MKKTFIVFGNFRGGTSMVSKCLIASGVFMGKSVNNGNAEDVEFQFADARKHIDLIKQRNSEHDIWGWKFPDSLKYVERFEQHLVNPHFICIFRDPHAIALSEVNRSGQDYSQMISRANSKNRKLIDFISSTEHKTLTLSYEHCITRKEEFINSLIKFTGLGRKEDVIKEINIPTNQNSFTYD